MTEPDTTAVTDAEGVGAAPRPDATAAAAHHEHVRTDGEVRVDDELGTGDNLH